ncbi:MAG TPA: c-type cytochrome [Gemmatimonadales bacterium]|nr:c-type cytochrome [Gemmatimonadales bacterium]
MRLQRIFLALGGLIVAAAALAAQQRALPRAGADTATAITPALIARGDSIFHGLAAGGTCFACHGAGGTGIAALTHDLTTRTRLNGDGSYRSIVQIVETGVAQPQQTVPMPPHGGAELTALDIRAVAAYVYSLSHPRRP